MRRTGFFSDERCFWHSSGSYAFILPAGGIIQPTNGVSSPESPESKRRLANLIHFSGLAEDLICKSSQGVTIDDLLAVHSKRYIEAFRAQSRENGGNLGSQAPFLKGSFESAVASAGLAKNALIDVLNGHLDNAYALCRPPGHHCLPDKPMGYCLLANIPIAIEAAKRAALAERFAVIDWDVHHGNGTETIYYDDPNVLTISIHQDSCYPHNTGHVSDRGNGNGLGSNINIPLPAGCGHRAYLHAFQEIVVPALHRFAPDVILVASGYDASIYDPLGRMMLHAETFAALTRQALEAANALCGGKIVLVHEGGYSEVHVPFCGHSVIKELSGSKTSLADPLYEDADSQQPNGATLEFQLSAIDEIAKLVQ